MKAQRGKLNICRLSAAVSTVEGGDEIILLVTKVDKNNIKVRFFEEGENGEVVWEEWGYFTKTDIHYEYAIVVKTPKYRDVNVDKIVDVKVQLARHLKDFSGGYEYSKAINFRYKPLNTLRSIKRSRLTDMTFRMERERLLNCNVTTVENDSCHELDILFGSLDEDFRSQILNGDAAPMKKEKVEFDGFSSGVNQKQELFKVPVHMRDISFINNVILSKNFSLATVYFKILDFISVEKPFENLTGFDNPLFTACISNQYAFIRSLLTYKCDPNAIDLQTGDTILHIVAKNNYLKCAKAIIQTCKAKRIYLNLNVLNYDGFSCLHLAIKFGNLNMVKYLIEEGKASVAKTDLKSGNNLLMLAIEWQYLDIIEYIIRLPEIDLSSTNLSNRNYLEFGLSSGNRAIISLIEEVLRAKGYTKKIQRDYGKSNEENSLQAIINTVQNLITGAESRYHVLCMLYLLCFYLLYYILFYLQLI